MNKKIVNIIILFISFTFVSINIYNSFYNKNTINKEIVIINKKDQKFTLSSLYLGYIEIEKYGIKNYIVDGTSDSILNTNVVGIHKASTDIDSSYGNLILAGHNNKYVFKNLVKVEINDEIKIVSKTSCYKYKVIKIDSINIDNFTYFNYEENKKIITLITCLSKTKRLIIRGILI